MSSRSAAPRGRDSIYYAAKSLAPSRRKVRDEELKAVITEVWDENFKVFGVRKMWKALRRRGETDGRDQVARLMRELGLSGVIRGKANAPRPATTPGNGRPTCRPGLQPARPEPAVGGRPDLRGDGWGSSTSRSSLTPSAAGSSAGRSPTTSAPTLPSTPWRWRSGQRQGRLDGLVHHSDRGVQYLAIRYTERLADAGAVTSVGSRGDSYDNALAESTIGVYKTELIRRQGPWRCVDDVELATLERITGSITAPPRRHRRPAPSRVRRALLRSTTHR